MDSQTLVTKLLLAVVGASAINLVTLAAVEAAAIISVDTNPLMPGIQSSLTVDPGDTFTVDILISDDGTSPTPTVFDTVILETFFNSAGAVLGLGTSGPIAGTLAGIPGTLDLFGGFVPTAPGTPLGTGPSFPAPPFSSGSGTVGLLGSLAIAPGPATSIFSIDFTALVPGTSTILAAGSPPGSPALAFGGLPIAVTLAPGTITVTGGATTTVPEPSTILGFWAALGLATTLLNKGGQKTKDE